MDLPRPEMPVTFDVAHAAARNQRHLGHRRALLGRCQIFVEQGPHGEVTCF
jgi:hypothetical protein